MLMETWFIILLVVIAVAAVTVLLFYSLIGDETIRLHKLKHRRGEYINDQTAVIYQTIKDTEDSVKAYHLFVEYLFTNSQHFLMYVGETMGKVYDAFNSHDVEALKSLLTAEAEMKVELKDQKYTQDDCLATIDPLCYVDNSVWINLASTCMFDINDCLRNVTKGCVDFHFYNNSNLNDIYQERVSIIVGDIRNICRTAYDLVKSGDIEGMRELRKRCSVILSESQSNTQRVYELLNDGRSKLDDNKKISLKYVLNNLQECHCLIYTLRRLVLCNIGLVLSLANLDSDNS